ncbi:MAG TPA: site-2 protease family protein, partial [Nitrosopumilus sp.]|nr:site-2 protease family protein [Nitrosopumilus sp.]
MEEDSQENIISLVNSIFNVGEFTKTEFTLEFKITDIEFQTK